MKIFTKNFSWALIALLMLAGCSLASEPIPAGPIESGPMPGEVVPQNVPITMPSASEGEAIFAARCAGCHGATGEGDGEFAAQLAEQGAELPDFSDPSLADQRTPQEWYTTITLGTIPNGGLMPPWREALTDAERWSVTYYLYSLSHTADELALGEEVFAARCAECHGEGDDALTLASIAVMSPAQIQNVLTGGDPHDFADLSAAERFAAARFAQTLGYDASIAVAEVTPTPAATAEPTAEGTPIVEAPTGSITVTGTISTAGGDTLPAGTEVKLTGVSVDAAGNFTTFLENTTATGDDGTYRFENLPIHEAEGGAAYVVTTIYQGVEFNNGAAIAADAPVMDLPIVVSEVTRDASVISVDSAHLVIRQNPDALLVLQVLIYTNTSDKVYVSDSAEGGTKFRIASVIVDLPEGAQNVTFEDGALGGRFVEVEGAIYDTLPIQPGERSHNIVVQYILPYEGGDFAIPLTYGASEVAALTSGEAAITSDQMSAAGTETISGEVYDRYIGGSVPRGSDWVMRVSPKGLNLQGILIPLLLGLSALLAIVGGVSWVMQQRMVGRDLTPALADLSAEADALIRQIAALDDQYDAGTIKRLEYEAQRAALKAQVAEHLQSDES